MPFFIWPGKDGLVKGVGALLIVALILLAFKEFSQQCFEHTYASNKARLTEISAQNTDAMRIEFRQAEELVASAAAGIALMGDPHSEYARKFLNAVQITSNFSRMWIVGSDGMAHNTEGESLDVSLRSYTHAAATGKSGIVCIHRSSFTETPIFCIFAPITKDGQHLGAVIGIYELESLIVKTSNPQFGGMGYVQVFDDRGDFVIRSAHAKTLIDTDNVFSFLRAADLGGRDYEEFRRSVAAGGSGVLTYKYKGQERMGYYGPIGTNDWIIFSSVPREVVTSLSEGVDDLAVKLVLKLIFCSLLLAAGIAHFSNKANRELMTANRELNLGNKRFRFAATNLTNGIIRYDFGENALSRMEDKSATGVWDKVPNPATGLIPGCRIDEKYLPIIEETLRKMRNGSPSESCIVQGRLASGESKWYTITFVSISPDDGASVEAMGSVVDVTSLKESENDLARKDRHRLGMLSSAVETFVFNITKGRYLYGFCPTENHEHKLDTMFSSKLERFITNTVHPEFHLAVLEALSEDRFKTMFEKGETRTEFEFRALDDPEGERWMKIITNLVRDPETGDLMGYSLVEDITKSKREHLALKRDAERDALTGLYNRSAANMLIERQLQTRRNGGEKRLDAFFMIDLDRFKYVNDTYGHAAGDEVLREMGAGLGALFRTSDIVGRMGGDEFVVFITDAKSTAVIRERAEGICRTLKRISFAANPEHRISGSVGILVIDSGTPELKELYEKADLALYGAKHEGRDCYKIFREGDAPPPP